MHKHLSILLAGAVAVSGAMTSFPSAVAMPRVIPAIESDSGGSIQEVRSRHRVWRHRGHLRAHRDHYRPRHFARKRFHHDHDDDDFDGALAAGIFGLAAGAFIGAALSHDSCADRYNSYNPATGTYLGYDGYYHRCVLP